MFPVGRHILNIPVDSKTFYTILFCKNVSTLYCIIQLLIFIGTVNFTPLFDAERDKENNFTNSFSFEHDLCFTKKIFSIPILFRNINVVTYMSLEVHNENVIPHG